MSRENYDDIKKAFDSDGVKRPESLSRDNVVNRIKARGIAPEKSASRSVVIKRIAAAAAAAAVVIGAAGVARTFRKPELSQSGELTSYVQEDGQSVDNYDDIEEYFVKLSKKNKSSVSLLDGAFSFNKNTGIDEDIELAEAAQDFYSDIVGVAEAGGGNGGTVPEEAFGKTNTQVADVDEADIVKNDGKYLYVVTDGITLSIIDAQTMALTSQIEIGERKDKEHLTVSNIYLDGDRLVAVCSLSEDVYGYPLLDGLYASSGTCVSYCGYNCSTVTVIYDVTDRAAPKELRRYEQDGIQISSRMVNSIIYNVTSYTVAVYDSEVEVRKNCIPTVDEKRVACNDIYWDQTADNSEEYIVLTACDTADPSSEVSSLSVLGYGNEVYCTRNTLFVASSSYDEKTSSDVSNISAFSISGLTLSYKASGQVDGWFNNQFSMDEFNGYFRVATTSYSLSTYSNESSVYVLDGDLKVVGRLENIAGDEEVKSVRFMGDTAYVVTFKNTDPLFVIDMSNPTAPTIVGEVKLPGFSSYLHPVGDGLILGVGYGGDDENADYDSVKVSLFDVSDPAKPREIDSYTVKNAYTSINYDPKAFMYYEQLGMAGIPLSIYRYAADGSYVCTSESFMVMKVSKDGLTLLNGFVHGDDESYEYFRGTYIGNSLYTLTNLLVKRYDLTSFECTGTLEIEGFLKKYEDITEAVSASDVAPEDSTSYALATDGDDGVTSEDTDDTLSETTSGMTVVVTSTVPA